MKKIFLIVAVVVPLLLAGCTNSSQIINVSSNINKSESQKQDQQEEKCFSYEDKKCVTKEEKEIIQLIPIGAILREIKPMPASERNDFIGIYIENPVIEATSTDDYMNCSANIRGQSVIGVYHLFTYSLEHINSDIIIPKSASWDDYNSSLSAQRIGMSWRNTKYNNFNNYNGQSYLERDKFNLEISNLINFEDYNGDGLPHEFILYGGVYYACGTDENLVAGYDNENGSAIIYKIMGETNSPTYWAARFIPDQNGNVANKWGCGDHGSEEEISVLYKYNPINKYYYFVNKTVKKCY